MFQFIIFKWQNKARGGVLTLLALYLNAVVFAKGIFYSLVYIIDTDLLKEFRGSLAFS